MRAAAVKKMLWRLSQVILALMWVLPPGAHAAQQYQGLCSYVKIEILQEMTLERIGFLATLTVTNNEGDASITNFSSALTFKKQGAGGVMEDASPYFFVQPPKIRGVNSISGSGIISPGQMAVVEWFIIPKTSAGGTTPEGLKYQVGAQLAGSIYGLEISQDVFKVLPDTITVKPDPQLDVTYFQPRDVDGDNPFTLDIVESPIPFTLGVLVKNSGYGPARKVKIASEQPRIIENLQGLLVVPQLIGSRVDDQPTESTTLTVNLGDIQPGKCRKGAWDMITTLSGEFTEFKASFTHAPELGGEETSLIKQMNAYFMVHEVLNDQPGRDSLLDFLAETQGGEQLIPDTLFESDCNTLPVNSLTNVEVLPFGGMTATVRATADVENWVFIRVDDPGQAKYPIASVVRSDGKVINSHNYWTNIRYRKTDNAKLTYLNIFDFVSLGEYRYTVNYQSVGADTTAPITKIYFSGQSRLKDGKYFVLPATQIFFIAQDASPVGTYYKLDGAGDFRPAYPFTIGQTGEHSLTFYSKDIVGNEEAPQTVTVVVSTEEPSVGSIATDTDELFIAGDSISVRPTSVKVSFNGVMTADGLSAVADVFRGVFAYATVSGAPSSPTDLTGATLTVGGENVDFYRYRLGAGAWSSEYAVAAPLELTGLSGTVQVSVAGRSRYGDYLSDDQAVSVGWTVSATADRIAVTGTPATPSRALNANLTVTGSSYYCYRVDGTYYRPDAGAGTPITLDHLSDGQHSVEVLARADAGASCPGDVPGTRVDWTVNRHYGLDFPSERRVRHADLGQVDDRPVNYVWDGRSDSGVVAPPGWYTVRIKVSDGLGRWSGAVKLVYVGDMVAGGGPLSSAGNAPQKEVHAFGRWAVWQDQRNGNWDIYAINLSQDAASAIQITTNSLNQERPRTDGRYVVWEDRQLDGTWDIWAKDLESDAAMFAVTATPASDETKPAVYWPWVVYQSRPVSQPDAPWQLMARNLSTETTTAVDPTTQNQIDASVYGRQVVWQDFRDPGYGEIYMKDLQTGQIKRITNNPGGQYYPVIFDQWIVWSDNRDGQFDLYGYNLKRQAEIRLTDTPENETRPYINGPWVAYMEDAAGAQKINLRLLNLANLASVQLTNEASEKEKTAMASGKLVWVDLKSGYRQVMAGPVPDLQPVFNNRNTVAVTAGMVANVPTAHSLLRLWHEQAGVQEITRYTSLIPQPVADTVTWAGAPVGTNFALEAGNFLWVRFNETLILDMGQRVCSALNLASGTSVFSYTCFPDGYSAFQVIREIGVSNIKALRLLASETGRWQSAAVKSGLIVGEDFKIPTVAVLMVEMNSPVGPWRPGEMP
jgi:beta propeller repeat protein